MIVPDWLISREGGLAKGLNERTWLVTMNGHPQWRLEAVPAKGHFSCAIMQSNNGQRLDQGKAYASQEAALTGGLDELRTHLGW